MNPEDIPWTPAVELAAKIKAREVSAAEVAEVIVERVGSLNPELNAFISFDPEQVLADAKDCDRKTVAGEEVGPLHGVPYSIKELTSMKGQPLAFGLKPLAGGIGQRDAAVVTRMRDAGGVFLGKTNTPESGYWGGTEGHLYGATHNPWKRDYSAGGSSGGAAAAVAAGLGPLAEGSDGAGSVRIPSSLCGVVGLKPSMGRIPQTILAGRYYTWAYHGPITRTVADSALMMSVVSGPHREDPMTLPDDGTDYLAETQRDISGWRIAYSPDLGLSTQVDPEVAAICADAVTAFTDLGAVVEEATPGWGDPEWAMWHGVWVPGFASEHDLLDWESLHGEVDDDLIGLMQEAEQLTGVQKGNADAFRGGMWDTYTTFMERYDLLVSPTLGEASFPHGQFCPDWLQGESLQRRLLGWLLTYPYNMLTTPAITVPAGVTSDGRPVGLQIAGGLHADGAVLRAAANFESARPWADRRPSL
ncbi:amidase [Streptomyces zhihengii]|uniref:Amidase n=1 Tax=Streptomyces zhihengii TaxID=1818004 RepID=A0ABS2V4X7_9ACTN|nr:amidase family protein [Streptomyces zhihengii]MBM9624631.1 amidase [Streptomyces zhihengii]